MKLSWRAFDAAAADISSDTTLGGWDADSALVDLADPEQRRIGDYELVEVLGRGGMGVVYRARQGSLGREVALKLLAGTLWTRADAATRFAAEAASAARMRHPNIVAIHEYGNVGERFYYSMELVEGSDLAARLRDGPLDQSEAASLVRDLARAVHYAHSLNVLHLDLKPQNVLLEPDGRARIADFGLARPLDRVLGAETEVIAGTPCYMAPEQALLRAADVSRSTDVYGLGAILYECLTGRAPFRGDSPEDTLRAVAEAPLTPPRRVRLDLSRDLEAVCVKCLQRDPADRYASAEDLAEDLGRVLDGNPVQARRLRWSERVWRWLSGEPVTLGGLATAALVMLAAGAAWMLQFDRSERAEALARDAFSASAEALREPGATRTRLETLERIVAIGHPHATLRSRDEQIEFLHRLRGAVAIRGGAHDDVLRELTLLLARNRMRRDSDDWRAALHSSPAPLAWLLAARWYEDEAGSVEHRRTLLAVIQRVLDAPRLSDPELALAAHLCALFSEMSETVQEEARHRCDQVFARAYAAAARNPLFLLLQPTFDSAARETWLTAMNATPLDDYGPQMYRETLSLLEPLAVGIARDDLANGLTARDVAALAAGPLLKWTFGQARGRVLAPCRALEKSPSALNLDHCRRSMEAPHDGWTYAFRDIAWRAASARLHAVEVGAPTPRPLQLLYDHELRSRLLRCCSQRGAHPEWIRLRSTAGERAAEAWLFGEHQTTSDASMTPGGSQGDSKPPMKTKMPT